MFSAKTKDKVDKVHTLKVRINLFKFAIFIIKNLRIRRSKIHDGMVDFVFANNTVLAFEEIKNNE